MKMFWGVGSIVLLASASAFANHARSGLEVHCLNIVSVKDGKMRIGATCDVRNKSTGTVSKIAAKSAIVQGAETAWKATKLVDTVHGGKSKLGPGEAFKTTYAGDLKGGAAAKCDARVKVHVQFTSSANQPLVTGVTQVICPR